MSTSTRGTDNEFASLEPLAWVTESHPLPAGSVDAVALHVIVPWPIFSTPNVCGGTAPPAATAVNVKPVCESRIVCWAELMIIVTGMSIRCPVVELAIETRPVYVPAPRVAGFAVTATLAPAAAVAVPLTGDTESH